MSNKTNFSYNNSKGQKVSGSAAFLHHVYTEKGGIKQYNEEVGLEYLKEFVREHSDSIYSRIVSNSKRKKFKVVGK